MAAYLKNRSPNRSIGSTCTPYELWHSNKPDLGHLHIFGCRCYAHLEEEHRKKWDSRTIEGVFFNYFNSEGLYLIFDVNKRTLIKKRDITFYENILGHPSMASYGLAPGFDILGAPVEDQDEIPEVVDKGDADGRIQKINELRPIDRGCASFDTGRFIYRSR